MTAGTRTAGTTAGTRDEGRSLAQWFCLIVGLTLLVVGILGFFVEAKFDTATGGDPGALDGENLIIFEVNGWHNVVHLASGLFLLAFAAKHAAAKTAAIAFGVIYGIVTVIGLVDGQDVLGILPVNPADNVLHILLSVAAIAAGLLSTRDDDDRARAGGDGDGGGRRAATPPPTDAGTVPSAPGGGAAPPTEPPPSNPAPPPPER